MAPGSASTSTHSRSPANQPPGGVGNEFEELIRDENNSYTVPLPVMLPPAPMIVSVSLIVTVTLVDDGTDTT